VVNTLFLPELREMLASEDHQELLQFCTALNPARTAEFMDGLTPEESWRVLQHVDSSRGAEIFLYFDHDRQIEILREQNAQSMADLIAELPADDRVDLLQELDESRSAEIMSLLPTIERREVQRLNSYAEGTAGSIMTTEVARLRQDLSVREAMEELGRQSEILETIYYIYVVDEEDRLLGVVSGRQLISALGKLSLRLSDLMATDILCVEVDEDRESVAQKVEKFDLLAIPVVDPSRKLVGIITHDDVIDVVREEMQEDAQMLAGVTPLREDYLRIGWASLSWKRGMWLTILFVTAMFTAFALKNYQDSLEKFQWIVLLIPLIVSTGGNSGNQAATLVITALASGELTYRDWLRVLKREAVMGCTLGTVLAAIGALIAIFFAPTWVAVLVIPLTVMLVVMLGCLAGSMLPLLFSRLGLDPALMANPFIAGIMDIMGIVIYLNVALLILR
jgi:magnesium transporter